MRQSIFATVAVAVLTLAGCGGGGGSNGGAANSAPQAAFTVTPSDGAAPLTVKFDGTSSNDTDGTITIFTWRFGDGTPDAVGGRVSHVYTNSGNFQAQLTVTDDRGSSGSRVATINVMPAAGTFTLSGRIQILPSSAIDSDVNDPRTVLVRNDTSVLAQRVPNPVSLGGYLNQPGQGPSGPLQAAGDASDVFAISFAGNETVLLTVTEPSVDVTLTLLDSGGTVVDASVVTGGSGALTAPTAGDFLIELDIRNGATTYVMNVGQNVPNGATALPARAAQEFVPGQFVVRGNTAAVRGAHRLAGSDHTALFAMDAAPNEAPARNHIRGVRDGAPIALHLARKYATLEAIAHIARSAGALHAEPNYIRRANRVPDDPFYSYQWHYPSINLPLAWDVTQGSDQVIVAVVDTGVLLDHPDLTGQLVAGYDFIRDPERARDGDGIDPDPTDAGDGAFGGSSSFHGTHVAGTIAAHSDNHAGVAGIAWGSRIMPVRVLGVDGGTSYDVIQGVRYAAGLANDSGTVPPQRADIINLSLGSTASSQAEQDAFDEVKSAGVIVVAAAGNDASSSPSFPAAYAGVVSVAASTITKTRAPYSNFGPTIDVVAPGGNFATDVNGDGLGDGVVSTIGDDSNGAVTFGYAALTGTSMAAPHVAGVAALMKSLYTGLSPAQFDAALSAGDITDDLGTPGRDDQFGAGLIDAQKAVITAIELANGAGTPVAPVLTAAPGSINFGAFDTMFDVVLRNAGGGSLSILTITTDQPWLTVAPVNTDADGLGTYRLHVDRNLAGADGTYAGVVTATSTAAPVAINVVMQKFSVSPTANAGLHYVLLIDPVTNRTVKFDTVTARNGEYDYQFDNVGPGQYQIYAGTDSDNDDRICDGGEACGAFRTLDTPETIVINGDRPALDFISGFPVNLFNRSIDTATMTPAGASHRPEPISRDSP